MTIAVTGASGRLGRLTIAELLGHVSASDLILITRRPELLTDLANRGASVRYGDFGEPTGLLAAFAGAQRALVISVIGPAGLHAAAFEAAARAGVEHLCYTSVPNPVPDSPFPPAAGQRASEQALRATGLAWTVLRNALYADLRAQIATAYIRDGRWTTNIGNGGHAFVSRRDCAAAAAGALTSDGHAGRAYVITGPELVDASGYTGLLEQFGGRPVDCAQVDDDAYERYRAAFQSDPRNSAYFELFTGTGRAIRTGYLGEQTTAVHELSGRPASSLRDVFEQYWHR
jgi:NAD(P)H dehydrogenase (quinone)